MDVKNHHRKKCITCVRHPKIFVVIDLDGIGFEANAVEDGLFSLAIFQTICRIVVPLIFIQVKV